VTSVDWEAISLKLRRDETSPVLAAEVLVHEIAHVLDAVGPFKFAPILMGFSGQPPDQQSLAIDKLIRERFKTDRARNYNEVRATAITISVLRLVAPKGEHTSEDFYEYSFDSMRYNLDPMPDVVRLDSYKAALDTYLTGAKTKRQADQIITFLQGLSQ
jgi:hypothetical protein